MVKGGTMIGDQVDKGTNTFASAYAQQKTATDKKIQDLITKYVKMDAAMNG